MTIQEQIDALRAELEADPFGPNSSTIGAKIDRLKRHQREMHYADRARSGDYGLGAQNDYR